MDIPVVPASQLNLIVPEGLSCTQKCEDGQITLAVNDESTNWALALASSGASVNAMWQVQMPRLDTVPSYVYMFYPAYDETSAAQEFDRPKFKPIGSADAWNVPCEAGPGPMPITEKTLQVARPIPEAGMMMPHEDDFWVYLGWYDDAQNPLLYQKVHISLTHTQQKAFSTKMPVPVPAERIVPDSGVTLVSSRMYPCSSRPRQGTICRFSGWLRWRQCRWQV